MELNNLIPTLAPSFRAVLGWDDLTKAEKDRFRPMLVENVRNFACEKCKITGQLCNEVGTPESADVCPKCGGEVKTTEHNEPEPIQGLGRYCCGKCKRLGQVRWLVSEAERPTKTCPECGQPVKVHWDDEPKQGKVE